MEHHSMIVETTDNRFWQVRETGSPDLAHVWLGTELKWSKSTQTFFKRPNRKGSGGRPQLVSKAHCHRIVEP
jgi:hypothetical protein